MIELLMAGFEYADKAQKVYEILDRLGVVDKVKNTYQDWSQQRKEETECQQLWESVFNLIGQQDYEQALSLLGQLAQKFPYNKALAFYISALCYFELHNYSQALSACKAALEASPNEDLLQKISALKAAIESVKANFGFGFWLQWLVATVIIGAISLFGTIGFLGTESSASGIVGVLSISVSVGFVQWLLIRLRTDVDIWSLIISMIIVLISLILFIMLSTVNIWLGFSAFFGCTILFTNFSIGRLMKQSA